MQHCQIYIEGLDRGLIPFLFSCQHLQTFPYCVDFCQSFMYRWRISQIELCFYFRILLFDSLIFWIIDFISLCSQRWHSYCLAASPRPQCINFPSPFLLYFIKLLRQIIIVPSHAVYSQSVHAYTVLSYCPSHYFPDYAYLLAPRIVERSYHSHCIYSLVTLSVRCLLLPSDPLLHCLVTVGTNFIKIQLRPSIFILKFVMKHLDLLILLPQMFISPLSLLRCSSHTRRSLQGLPPWTFSTCPSSVESLRQNHLAYCCLFFCKPDCMTIVSKCPLSISITLKTRRHNHFTFRHTHCTQIQLLMFVPFYSPKA